MNARKLLGQAAIVATAALGAYVPEFKPSAGMSLQSGAPPARTVAFVDRDDAQTLRISAGVAVMVTAWQSCPRPEAGWSTTIAEPTIEIADRAVLDLREASNGRPQGAWVLFGVKPGTTTVTVKSACTTRTYGVTVLPGAPAAAGSAPR